jgi:hypothetical protein
LAGSSNGAPDEPGRERLVSGVISEGDKSDLQALVRRRRGYCQWRSIRPAIDTIRRLSYESPKATA